MLKFPQGSILFSSPFILFYIILLSSNSIGWQFSSLQKWPSQYLQLDAYWSLKQYKPALTTDFSILIPTTSVSSSPMYPMEINCIFIYPVSNNLGIILFSSLIFRPNIYIIINHITKIYSKSATFYHFKVYTYQISFI